MGKANGLEGRRDVNDVLGECLARISWTSLKVVGHVASDRVESRTKGLKGLLPLKNKFETRTIEAYSFLELATIIREEVGRPRKYLAHGIFKIGNDD